jgi:hypothetical protein
MGRQARTRPVNEGRYATAENLGTATTGSTVVSIPNYGLSVIAAGSNTYVLDAPEAGVTKFLYSAAGSSGARIVKLHPVSSGDSITVGSGGATEIAIHSTDNTVISLVGVSSVKWALLTATTGAVATVNTTGIVLQAS